ncbi:MAG: phosphate acyltransferase PlsX [bacterium]
MTQRPTLVMDVMGSDLGVSEMLRGVADFCDVMRGKQFDVVVVHSAPDEIENMRRELAILSADSPTYTVRFEHARDVLPKEFTSPVDAFKKYPDSSIRRSMEIAKEHPQSAVISPGTTGLVMTAGLFTLGRVKGIDRPPIGTPLPTHKGDMWFVDGGSNVDCKALHLHQFAILAHLFVKTLYGKESPRIALLSNGTEDYKGNALVKEARALIEADPRLNCVGYVEGHSLFDGEVDIMVCDGFLGNITLKLAEGVGSFMTDTLRNALKRNMFNALAAKLFLGPALREIRTRTDYAQWGGAPLLGLKGNVIICHGRSNALAIRNALKVGYELSRRDLVLQVEQVMADYGESPAG